MEMYRMEKKKVLLMGRLSWLMIKKVKRHRKHLLNKEATFQVAVANLQQMIKLAVFQRNTC